VLGKAWLTLKRRSRKIEQEPERSHLDKAETRTSIERFAYMREQGYELGSFYLTRQI
jgi:hypothetical protein